jgi:hypothetical protein
MNKLQKSLLGMASLLALTAGQKSAEAALAPSDIGKTSSATALTGYSAYADPLFELMKRTNGSFKPQVIEAALRDMLADPSPAQVEAAPALLDGLAGLGAPSDLVGKSRDVIIELVSKAANINDELKETTESKLKEAGPGTYKLAQTAPGSPHFNPHHERRPKKIERLRRPPEVGQTPIPAEIGQTSGYSDVRVKQNITLVDRLKSGLGLYRFNYIGSDQAYIGVMAQEVEAVMPEAVIYGDDGYMRVRYDLLGMRMQTWEEWTGSGPNGPVIKH